MLAVETIAKIWRAPLINAKSIKQIYRELRVGAVPDRSGRKVSARSLQTCCHSRAA